MASKRACPEPVEGEESFEEVYRRLEETVAKLEEGGLPLARALALYEEGMKLAQRCQQLLAEAELRITRLQEAFAAYSAELSQRSAREDAAAYTPSEEEELPLE